MRVLVVDDHPKLRANVRAYLKLKGIESDESFNGQEALQKARAYAYSVIVLDLNMPILSGRDFLKELRASSDSTPVIVLTSDSLLEDKVELLEAGADDYLTKPFAMEELAARVRTLARRIEKPVETKLELSGGVRVDLGRMRLERDGTPIELSAKEYGVVEFLARHRGTPKNKGAILEAVWGETEESLSFDSVTLEAHVSSIRRKLGKEFVKNIRNVWYVIE